MGTRSYYAYYFGGRYYVLYLHWDGYPEGVGTEIVKSIPEDPVEYQKWLQAQRCRLAKWEQVLEKQILCVSSSKLPSLLAEYVYYEPELLLRQLLDDRFDPEMPTPCYHVPDLNLNIEFTYTIDLDREVFTINNGAHFVLSKIPRTSWIKSLAYLEGHSSQIGVVIDRFVPEDSIADLASLRPSLLPTASKTIFTDEQRMHFTTVHPKGFLDFAMAIRHGPLLLSHLWEYVSTNLASSMRYILRGLSPDEFVFREIAFSIISLCAGLSNGMKFENGERYKVSWTKDWGALVLGDDPRGPPVILPRVALGYHAEGVEPGSAPQETTYWFCGVLVKLVADLTKSDQVQEAIIQAIDFARSTSPAEQVLDIILLSIEHVVLLHIVGEKAERTDTITLVDIPFHFTGSPIQQATLDRYGLWFNRWADTNNETNEPEDQKVTTDGANALVVQTTTDDELAIHDGEDAEEAGQERHENPDEEAEAEEEEEEEEKEEDENGEDEDVEVVSWPQKYRGFFAMMHVFEAVVQRAMVPARDKEGVFPTEIYEMILACTDDSTYQACSTVSRKFRRYCLQHLRLLSGAVISGLTPPRPVSVIQPKNPAREVLDSDVTTSQPDRGRGSKYEKYTDNAQNDPTTRWLDARFVLYDQAEESHRAYNILPLWEHSYAPEDSTEWLAICGKSKRLSLVTRFFFRNYQSPDPWEKEGPPTREFRHRTRSSENSDRTRYWSSRWFTEKLELYHQEPNIRHLFELWQGMIMTYGIGQLNTHHMDTFSMQAHTNESIFLAKAWSFDPQEDSWIGYIRYKRPDAVAGVVESWEQAYSEAEEKIREKAAKQEYQPMFVITAVMLSARLHRWDPQSQRLLPVGENGGELNILAEGDREKMEKFLLEMKAETEIERAKLDEQKQLSKAIAPLGEN